MNAFQSSILFFGGILLVSTGLTIEPPQSIQALSQTYSITRKYKSMEGPASTQPLILLAGQKPELVWITGFRTEIVGEDGRTPTSQEFMCHINLDANMAEHGKLFGWKKVMSPRLFTLSQAQFSVDFPKGFGMPVLSNESFSLATQVLNHNLENANVQVRHKVTVDFVKDSDLKSPMQPLFATNGFVMHLLEGDDGNFGMPKGEVGQHGPTCQPGLNAEAAKGALFPDSFGRKFSGHWIVKPGRIVSHTNVTKLMNLPFDTTLHYINIHLHPFAEWIELTDLTTNKRIFRSKVRGPKKGIGLDHIDTYSSTKGIPVYKDHEYNMAVSYNNTSGVDQDAMATMFIYLLDKEFKKPDPAALQANLVPPVPVRPAIPPAFSTAGPAKDDPRITLETALGKMKLRLFAKAAPKTVAHIMELARAGAYDTTHIIRIEPGFVAQLPLVYDRATPLSSEQRKLIRTVPLELNNFKHRRGMLSMARQTNDPNSGESSFSLMLGPATHLDGQYTIFGEVETGLDVLAKIEQTPCDTAHKPLQRLDIKRAEVSRKN